MKLMLYIFVYSFLLYVIQYYNNMQETTVHMAIKNKEIIVIKVIINIINATNYRTTARPSLLV